jgi:uncharacterized protein with HEPN domain
MAAEAVQRVAHVKEAIENIRALLSEKAREDLESDIVVRAAFERFVEILSEASRRIPSDWKELYGPQIPWRDIANIGNVLRHVYENVQIDILWSVYADDLDPLELAIDAMLTAHRK